MVIVGGGGHGLACAHYLARYHGISRVAVLEKGWLAGGNTARNTTTIRSNYMTMSSTAFCKEAVAMSEAMSEELDFNVMFSQRGQLMLARTEATLRAFHLRAETGHRMGIGIEVIGPDEVRARVPGLNMDAGGALEVPGGLWHPDGGTARHDAVAWGHARAASRRGLEIHQRTGVTGFQVAGGRVTGVVTNRGRIGAAAVLIACGGMNYDVALRAGVDLPIRCYPLRAVADGMDVTAQNVRGSLAFDRDAAIRLFARFLPVGFYDRTFMGPTRQSWLKFREPRIRARADLGRLDTAAVPAPGDTGHLHCDVLVVGGGPAGRAAAATLPAPDDPAAPLAFWHQPLGARPRRRGFRRFLRGSAGSRPDHCGGRRLPRTGTGQAVLDRRHGAEPGAPLRPGDRPHRDRGHRPHRGRCRRGHRPPPAMPEALGTTVTATVQGHVFDDPGNARQEM